MTEGVDLPQAAVSFALLEEGMHSQEVITPMMQPSGGTTGVRPCEEGPGPFLLLRPMKMRGMPPQQGHDNFSFSRVGLEVSHFAR